MYFMWDFLYHLISSTFKFPIQHEYYFQRILLLFFHRHTMRFSDHGIIDFHPFFEIPIELICCIQYRFSFIVIHDNFSYDKPASSPPFFLTSCYNFVIKVIFTALLYNVLLQIFGEPSTCFLESFSGTSHNPNPQNNNRHTISTFL